MVGIPENKRLKEHVDRISGLPLHIIHKIMSHLSRKDVARTSLLSKTWKNDLRPSFPILAFDHEDFATKGLPQDHLERFPRDALFRTYPQRFTQSMEGFTGLVDATMDKFLKMNLRMKKFELHIGIQSNFEHLSSLVNKWIGLALENQVEELGLAFWLLPQGLYPLPETVFFAESITSLSLSRCKLDHPSNAEAFRFHSVRTLKLMEVRLDELMIHKLTSSSPLLEYFVIRNCMGLQRYHLPSLERLKTLVIIDSIKTIPNGQLLKIEAPNLHHCTIEFFRVEGSSSISSSFNYQYMRKLELHGNLITDHQALADLFCRIFPLLEEFSVHDWILTSINISSQRLKQLKISRCGSLKAIHINTPNLQGFFFRGRDSIPIASINAPCPGIFEFQMAGEVDNLWYLNLRNFLAGNSKHRRLLVFIWLQMHLYNPEELRRVLPSPPCEIQDLYFIVYKLAESEYAALLDAYFSVCYPRRLLCHPFCYRRQFYMWFYKTLTQRDAYHCDCSYIHCWRHYLKGISKIRIKFPQGDELVFEGDALMNAKPHLELKGEIEFYLEWHADSKNA